MGRSRVAGGLQRGASARDRTTSGDVPSSPGGGGEASDGGGAPGSPQGGSFGPLDGGSAKRMSIGMGLLSSSSLGGGGAGGGGIVTHSNPLAALKPRT